MKKFKSLVFTLVFVFALQCVCFAQGAVAPEPSAGAKAADVLIVRPVATVGASALFIVYCVTAIPAHVFGQSEAWYQTIVAAPWGYVNQRPLGEF